MNNLRDASVKTAMNNHPLIKRLGKVHQLRIDAPSRELFLTIGLEGEPEPIKFHAKYDIERTDSNSSFVINEIDCEKAWINELITLWLSQKGTLKIPLNDFLLKILDKFI